MSRRNPIQLLSVSMVVAALFMSAATAAAAEAPPSQKYEKDGVSVEFLPSANPMEGEEVELRFWVRGVDGTRIASARPAAWIDARSDKAAAGAGDCKQKVQSFLTGSLGARPQVDLNTYYILALNAEPSISVIDPILGFGGSRLLTAVTLRSPGSDWTLSKDQGRLFVAMPLVNQVAVIDTASWSVIKNVEAGYKPAALALSPDGKSLWVADQNEAANVPSVTVIDTTTLAVVARLESGRGPHRLAFSHDHRLAAVTNGAEGTVSLVDAQTFQTKNTLKSGPSPVAVTASALSASLYIADAKDGSIAVIDPIKQQISARIAGKAGASSIRFAPNGRWGFVTLPAASQIEILDSSNGSVVATFDVGKEPDQVSFTESYAYVRSRKAEDVTMVRLTSIEPGQKPSIATFPGGQLAPAEADAEAVADAITAPPDPGAVLVANPADHLIYHYSEGMAAPMGNYQTYGRTPKAALVIDRSLREKEPGLFAIKTKVPAAGTYDVAFFLDSPRVVQCFNLAVRPDPEAKRIVDERAVKVEPIVASNVVRAGQPFDLQFKVTSALTGQPKRGLKDVHVLTFAPGVWQQREFAQPSDDGVYHVTANVPKPGIYYVFLECPSLGLRLNALRPVILEAKEVQ